MIAQGEASARPNFIGGPDSDIPFSQGLSNQNPIFRLCDRVATGDSLKKFSKIIFFAYLSPYFAFLLFSDFKSAEKRFPTGAFDRVFTIYFFFGIFVLPFLVFGMPSFASIKTEISSDRVRRGVNRKLQTVSISVALVAIVGLIRYFVPPRDAVSATINIVVFLTIFCLLMWAHFRRGSD
jgi:hypothetical protein